MLNQTMRCFIMDGNILQISMTDYLKEKRKIKNREWEIVTDFSEFFVARNFLSHYEACLRIHFWLILKIVFDYFERFVQSFNVYFQSVLLKRRVCVCVWGCVCVCVCVCLLYSWGWSQTGQLSNNSCPLICITLLQYICQIKVIFSIGICQI